MTKKEAIAGSERAGSILDVGQHNACTGCATCAGVCPSGAVEMVVNPSDGYKPQIDQGICTLCHLCMEVCPCLRAYTLTDGRREFIFADNLHELTERTFGSLASDELLGHCRGYYRGHACDDALRYNSASGGVVTALLLYALRSGVIDGAVVVQMSTDMPLNPHVFIATTEQEIIEAAQSKYCPVPLNLAIREIMDLNGRVAIVGLPCHIQGVRKAEWRLPRLAEKVVLHIALTCFHTVTFAGTRFLLAHNKVDPKQVTRIEYRGRGWPGSMLIRTADGGQRSIPYKDTWSIAFNFFSPLACFSCRDAAGELADVSVGDAWLPELRSEYGCNPGENLVIGRSEMGERLLAEAQGQGAIELQDIPREAVLGSLHRPLVIKKRFRAARLRAMQWLGLRPPELPSEGKSSLRAALYSICDIGITLLAARPTGYRLLVHTPSIVLKGITTVISLIQEDAGHLLAILRSR